MESRGSISGSTASGRGLCGRSRPDSGARTANAPTEPQPHPFTMPSQPSIQPIVLLTEGLEIGRSSDVADRALGVAHFPNQRHLLATLSEITPPRDGGSFAMSIGAAPLAAGHDGPAVHWVLPLRAEPAPYAGATGHDGPQGRGWAPRQTPA